MTEVERIIKDGILPESFFVPETICDFYVDETRKKVWAIELDLLLQIDKVCKKYNLKYFLVWGSMLGAIRHNGFIPWDDDLDLALPRKDYDELLLHANEFETPYFLQTPYTDPGYYYSHAKLRNSNTSALDYPFLFQGFNMGVFIDILPLDRINKDIGLETFNIVENYINENNIAMRLTHPYLNERDKQRVATYCGNPPLKNYDSMQLIARQNQSDSNTISSLLMAVVYGYEKDTWNNQWFEELVECTLYGVIKTYVPKDFDKILKKTYGDYMRFPPIEKRGVWHSNVKFLPDVPYPIALANWEKIFDKNNPNTNQMTEQNES